jgi:hypothetical protein
MLNYEKKSNLKKSLKPSLIIHHSSFIISLIPPQKLLIIFGAGTGKKFHPHL